MGSTTVAGKTWALEVVRGRDAGRVFPLEAGEVVLGNQPGDRGVLDLADQEAASSRKMAGRHAVLESSGGGLAVRDLESPGGTFVNRRRVLPGRSDPLKLDDVIQVGGVQLRVIAGERPSPPISPASTFSYPIPGAATCRSWDDFLAISSQRWEAVRDELTSGRLAAFLISTGHPGLAPSSRAAGTPDEQLDAWLASLPTSRPARPELDVYPARLVVKVTPGGGSIRREIRVSNVGDRLLRFTARVEPAGLSWLSVAESPYMAVEGADLPVEIAIPDTLPGPLRAEVVVEGNGGTKRVAVILEAKPAADAVGLPIAGDVAAPIGDSRLLGLIARQSPGARVATWALVALVARLLVGVAAGSIGADAMVASGPDSPALARVAAVLASLGAIAGGIGAGRRGGRREIPSGSFAGAFAGLLLASGLVATCRSVEPILGSWSSSVAAVCLLWAAIGAGLAGLSTLVVKGDG